MNRRNFLALGGVGIGAAGGYVGWRWYSPSRPDGIETETEHFERDVLSENSSRESEFLEWKEEYRTTVPDRDAARSELIDHDSVTSFLNNTDFEESYLIVVQNGMQSEMELLLDGVSREEDGLHLSVTINSPQGGPDDLLTHSLLIRVIDEHKGVPEGVSVDIEGYV
jgi:hypothetical protein